MDGQNGNAWMTKPSNLYDVMFSSTRLIDDDCLTGKCYCCHLNNNVHRVTESFRQTCDMICEQSRFMAKMTACLDSMKRSRNKKVLDKRTIFRACWFKKIFNTHDTEVLKCVSNLNIKLLRSPFTQFSLFYWPSVLHCTKSRKTLPQNNAVHGLLVFVHIQKHRVCFLSLFAVHRVLWPWQKDRARERERPFILCRRHTGLAHILWINAYNHYSICIPVRREWKEKIRLLE